MKITFHELTMRNFLSYGNNTTTINLNFLNPTLIVGRNYDAIVDGQIDSNGAGKTTLLNAVSVCAYDKTITGIDKSDIVNYINAKNMEVTLTFTVDNINYKIERYRKNKAKGGDGVRLYINPTNRIFDESHDKTPDSAANTNREIERILGIPFEIFSRIVVFTASHTPFLSLPASHATQVNQRDIIEELFGLTELTRKAELLKEEISSTKKLMTAIAENNDRLWAERGRYEIQLGSAKTKRAVWETDRTAKVATITESLKYLLKVDIAGIRARLDTVNDSIQNASDVELNLSAAKRDLVNKQTNNYSARKWVTDRDSTLATLSERIAVLQSYDIVYLKSIQAEKSSIRVDMEALEKQIGTLDDARIRSAAKRTKIIAELNDLDSSKCPYCKQAFHETTEKREECAAAIAQLDDDMTIMAREVKAKHVELEAIYARNKELSAIQIPSDINNIETELDHTTMNHKFLNESVNPFTIVDVSELEAEVAALSASKNLIDGIARKASSDLMARYLLDNLPFSEWSYNNLDAIQMIIDSKLDALDDVEREINPFVEIVAELQETLDNDIRQPDVDGLDDASTLLRHQDFLLKLLTKKDSFVRKALLNKNLPFLNQRLAHYLNIVGFTHSVVFLEDMSVRVSKFNTTYAFAAISSGQKARINLALAFAFRDVLQARFSTINLCILDECLDVGLGNVGVQLAAKMIKRIAAQDKLSLFIISHKDEISTMFDAKLEVELKGGFSYIKGAVEEVDELEEIEE